MAPGSFKATIVEARNLSGEEKEGKMEVYCLAAISVPEVSQHKTRIKRKFKKAPPCKTKTSSIAVWNETFDFLVEDTRKQSFCLIEVWSRNRIVDDVNLGYVAIQLNDKESNKSFDEWLPLQKYKKTGPYGEIHVQYTVCFPTTGVEPQPNRITKTQSNESDAPSRSKSYSEGRRALVDSSSVTKLEREVQRGEGKRSNSIFKRGAEPHNRKNVQRKMEAFRKVFGLPDTETLRVDSSASYRPEDCSILVHGRLYISENFICFLSNIFRVRTVEVIPVDTIKSVEKVSMGDSGGVLVLTKPSEASPSTPDSSPTAEQAGSSSTPAAGSGRRYLFTSQIDDQESLFKDIVSAWKRDAPRKGDAESVISDTVDDASDSEDDGLDNYMTAEFEGDRDFLHAVKMTTVVDDDLNVSVVKFFKMFFSDESDFNARHHAKRGDTELTTGKWQDEPPYGRARNLHFRAPVNAKMGPKSTIVDESQKYSMSKLKLTIETVAVMRDIPYADHFQVEGRWTITSATEGASKCHVTVEVGVNFIKRTMFKGMIESSTINESKISYTTFIAMAKEEIQKKRGGKDFAASEETVRLPAPGDAPQKALLAAASTPAVGAGVAEPAAITHYLPFLNFLLICILVLIFFSLSHTISQLQADLADAQSSAQALHSILRTMAQAGYRSAASAANDTTGVAEVAPGALGSP